MRALSSAATELRACRAATRHTVGAASAWTDAMSHEVSIACRGTRCTPAMEACIRFWAARLDLAQGPIERCEVTIDRSQQPGRRRRTYHVGLTLTRRDGPPTVIDRQEVSGTHAQLFAAVRDAFTLAGLELAARGSGVSCSGLAKGESP